MEASSIRVLVVDDYEPWRQFVLSTLENELRIRVVGEALDGLEAVQKTKTLQPDLIIVDIGLPNLNGIEAARRIRALPFNGNILFLSENRSSDIVEEALCSGASAFVVKSAAAKDLLPAIDAVLECNMFISASLVSDDHGTSANPITLSDRIDGPAVPQHEHVSCSHEVGFDDTDQSLMDHVADFIGSALKLGNAGIVVTTESHREGILRRLKARRLDIVSAIAQGRFVILDARSTLSKFMVNGVPDPKRFLEVFDPHIASAARAVKAKHPHVAVFGECVHLLLSEDNAEAAIQVEKFVNQLNSKYSADILCATPLLRFKT